MNKRILPQFTIFLVSLLVPASNAAFAQTQCAYENLIGEWREAFTAPGEQTNFDSLKTLASASKKNFGVWNFMSDKRYTYLHALWRSKYKRKGVYIFYGESCEVVIGTKPNARQRANLEILYLDNNYLIYKSDNNPKGYFTHVLVRYKKKIRGR